VKKNRRREAKGSKSSRENGQIVAGGVRGGKEKWRDGRSNGRGDEIGAGEKM